MKDGFDPVLPVYPVKKEGDGMNGMNRIESEDALVDLQLFARADHVGFDVAVDAGHGWENCMNTDRYPVDPVYPVKI